MRVESSHSTPTGTRWYHTVIPLVPDGTTLSSHWYQMAPHCNHTGTRWHHTVLPLVPDGTTLSSHWYQMAPHCPPLVPDGTTLSSHWYQMFIFNRSTDAEWGGAGITHEACSNETFPGSSRHHNEHSTITSRSIPKVYLH